MQRIDIKRGQYLVCLLTNFLFNPDDYERRQYLDP